MRQNSPKSISPVSSSSNSANSARAFDTGTFTLSMVSAVLNSPQSRLPSPLESSSLKTWLSSFVVSPRCTRMSWIFICTSKISFFSHAARKASPMIVMGIVVKRMPHMIEMTTMILPGVWLEPMYPS